MKRDIQILIVEDSNDDALLLIHELKKGGFLVQPERVETAAELRDILPTRHWDIVLSDYTLPQFNAIEVLHILSELQPNLPCIIISGTVGEDTAVAAMQAGARDFFIKGRLARLCAAIQREITESENLRQKRKIEKQLSESEEQRWLEREEALKRETVARQRIEVLYSKAQATMLLQEEFLANLSHELRTPMNAITGWAELLAKGGIDLKDYPAAFDAIYRNAQTQNRLIVDLLDLSQMITGNLKIKTKPISIEDVVRAALESVKQSVQAKDIELNVNMSAGMDAVFGDPQRLQEAIWHLLNNAIKFTLPRGSVGIEVRRAEGMAEVRISDTGEGIDPAFLPYVFDRFRQADGSMTRKQGGLGIGLCIVQHLVELHGGNIKAASDGIGKGAVFTLRLPFADK